MKRYSKVLLTTMLLCGVSFIARAQKNIEFVLPSTPFNQEEADKMLEEGNSTIQGNISFKKRGYVNYPGFSDMVLLYPATAYFQEYIELKKKYNTKKKQAGLTREAAMARIETKTLDSKGNFVFTNIKPGLDKKKELTMV